MYYIQTKLKLQGDAVDDLPCVTGVAQGYIQSLSILSGTTPFEGVDPSFQLWCEAV